MPGGEGPRYQIRTRVRNRRRTGVGNERNVTVIECFHHLGTTRGLIVLVVGNERRLDREVRKQTTTVPSVLGGDETHLTQRLHCAR